MMEGDVTSLRIARRLTRIELRDWQGVPHRLGEFWKERPIVLLFIRHFG